MTIRDWVFLEEESPPEAGYYIVYRPEAKTKNSRVSRAYWDGRLFVSPGVNRQLAEITMWTEQPPEPRIT